MKKSLLLVLSLVLILSMLAGCTSKSANNQGSSDTIRVGLNYELSI